VKRLEAALTAFGPGFHVYQYLFKSNRPDIPFAKYEDEPTRCAGGRIQTGRHRRPGRLPSCPGRRAITWRFLAHDCAVWPGVIWSLKNGTRSTRGRVHRRLHQCGRQFVCRDLQPAQRLFRHPSGQLCDQRPQAVSAKHELRRPVSSLYDPARQKDERASRYGVSGCARNRQQHAILSEPA